MMLLVLLLWIRADGKAGRLTRLTFPAAISQGPESLFVATANTHRVVFVSQDDGMSRGGGGGSVLISWTVRYALCPEVRIEILSEERTGLLVKKLYITFLGPCQCTNFICEARPPDMEKKQETANNASFLVKH